jgi:hydroxyacylglutathione hydrolase
MPLQITLLGTGGALCDWRVNYNTNAVLHTPEGPFLIDCGVTAPQSLKEVEIPAGEIIGVFLTHMHGDHSGGLEQLIWERFYLGPKGPAWKDTPIYGSNFMKDALRRALADATDTVSGGEGITYAGGYELLVKFNLLDPEGTGINVGGVHLESHKVHHVTGVDVDKPTYGLLIREPGKSAGGIYWSSDCVFDPEIGSKYPDVDVIFHDCTFMPKYPGTVHTHYQDLKVLPPSVRSKVILMHHTAVPKGVDVRADGFLWSASRHETVSLFKDGVMISGGTGKPLLFVGPGQG